MRKHIQRDVVAVEMIRRSLGNMTKLRLFKKNTKVSWPWWHAPVLPATRKAETGESPEHSRQRLNRART